jgi:hypothetical protein
MQTVQLQGWRLLRRVAFFILTLALVDGVLALALPPLPAVLPGERLPADRETVMLPFWLEALKHSTSATKVAFLGSSPTWGTAMPEATTTYPVRFATHWNKAHPERPVQAFNLAAKGFLAADLNYVLAAALPDADAFVIQLNYHTFSPQLLAATPIRHADLPERLGMNVNYEEAKRLGARPSPLLNLNTPLRHILRDNWRFYREREARAVEWLRTTPEHWLYTRFFPEAQGADEDMPSPEPFYDLKPARQLYIMQRYRQNANFDLQDNNTELYFVRRMLAQLRQAQKPAIVYVAPINLEALDYYEAIDQAQFRRNLDKLKAVVVQAGFHWVDLNTPQPLSEAVFADVSHTLPAGGDQVGKALVNHSAAYLREHLP